MVTITMAANIKFSARAERFPPILCRLMARRCAYGEPLSNIEIASRSKLSTLLVEQISGLTTWDNVPWGQMVAFLRGCNVDFDDASLMHRHWVYLRKKPGFSYLRRHPHWEAYFQPLLVRWLDVASIETLKRWTRK